MTRPPAFDVVIPSAGRPSLEATLLALAAGDGPWPGRVVVVDDRGGAGSGRPLVGPDAGAALHGALSVLHGPARGPAAARNAGWRACQAPWICFLDDDVVPGPDWRAALAADLADLDRRVAGSQGRLEVPLPAGRRPTDWERDVAGLEGAAWATADMAYRRSALEAVGGFDERFPRAYREDADLALRTARRGWRLVRGERRTVHPVRPDADLWTSVRRQAGNADDRLMDVLHGRAWRARASAPQGALPRHLRTCAAGVAAAGLAAAGRPRAAAIAGAIWATRTLAFAWRRIAPGPRTLPEVRAMLVTSAAIPPVAAWHALRGRLRAPALARTGGPHERPAAVLFDRDDTIIRDVPYNGDPARVAPMPGAAVAVARVRAAGIPVGIVSNQSGIARGRLTPEAVDAVNARVAELLGPFDVVTYCPHGPGDGCACRKPAPGLVRRAAAVLRVEAADCVVIGDIGADVGAARAAGARGILVPTARTRPEEVLEAREVASDVLEAVELALGTPAAPGPEPVLSVPSDPRATVAA
jgi:HAD superfamily hydrolase (TIGR01662 family)